jgi:hypothetical protein
MLVECLLNHLKTAPRNCLHLSSEVQNGNAAALRSFSRDKLAAIGVLSAGLRVFRGDLVMSQLPETVT